VPGAWRVLSWPSKMRAGKGSFLGGKLKLALKKIFGRPAPGERHQAHALFEVAAAGQEVESLFYEGLRVQWDQVGLVLVDALSGGLSRVGVVMIPLGGLCERKLSKRLPGKLKVRSYRAEFKSAKITRRARERHFLNSFNRCAIQSAATDVMRLRATSSGFPICFSRCALDAATASHTLTARSITAHSSALSCTEAAPTFSSR